MPGSGRAFCSSRSNTSNLTFAKPAFFETTLTLAMIELSVSNLWSTTPLDPIKISGLSTIVAVPSLSTLMRGVLYSFKEKSAPKAKPKNSDKITIIRFKNIS